MSEFIVSFIESIKSKPNRKIKIFFNIITQQWVVRIIPVIDIYLDTFSPIEHKRIMKDGFVGLFLSISWLHKSYIFGIHRK